MKSVNLRNIQVGIYHWSIWHLTHTSFRPEKCSPKIALRFNSGKSNCIKSAELPCYLQCASDHFSAYTILRGGQYGIEYAVGLRETVNKSNFVEHVKSF